MKKANTELNSIFCVAEEMVADNGEDCFYYDVKEGSFIIASFDGCGGSGSKKYENYSGKTGAYIASRAVCGGVRAWFNDSRDRHTIKTYIENSLSVCTKYADKAGRIMGSLGKSFPTTASIITADLNKDKVETVSIWAGDSRCYVLDFEGLHQITADDLDSQDAMTNLTNDAVMTNVINASMPFEIHTKKWVFNSPCILITATDGCFGYLNSPMEFEFLITDSLTNSQNVVEWKKILNERIKKVTGDDYTLCVAVCGFKDFDDIKQSFRKRNSFVEKTYINSQNEVATMWDIYKNGYSMYL